jgi:hypothetical protein
VRRAKILDSGAFLTSGLPVTRAALPLGFHAVFLLDKSSPAGAELAKFPLFPVFWWFPQMIFHFVFPGPLAITRRWAGSIYLRKRV